MMIDMYRFEKRHDGRTTLNHSIESTSLPMSHTCCTEIDETDIFMRFYTHVETWCGG